jgi:hypothetical protein
MRKFRVGERVTHQNAKGSIDMDAIVVGYEGNSDLIVLVEYIATGRSGRWQQRYVISLDDYEIHEDAREKIKSGGWSSVYEAYEATKAEIKADFTKQLNDEDNMNHEIKEILVNGKLVETQVNNRNVEDYDVSELLGLANNAQNTIEKLGKHDGSKCNYLSIETERLHKFIDEIYKLVDMYHLKK